MALLRTAGVAVEGVLLAGLFARHLLPPAPASGRGHAAAVLQSKAPPDRHRPSITAVSCKRTETRYFLKFEPAVVATL